jgi:sugar-specific transcriptional regulator TrmB
MEVENFLDEIGLSQYEKKTYLTLLRIGNSKSKRIAKESGVSYGRIYEILDKLEDKGLVIIIPTEPKTFDAVDPKLAFNLIIKREEEKIHKLKKEIASLKIPDKLPHIQEDKTLVLKGKQKQISMISEMHERAKKEILLIPGVYKPIVARNIATLRALNRGVKMKKLIRKVNPENIDILKKSAKLGEKIRKTYLPGLRLIVADDKEAMISIVNPKSKERDRISIYTTNKEFAKSIAVFFDSIWENSKKIEIKL